MKKLSILFGIFVCSMNLSVVNSATITEPVKVFKHNNTYRYISVVMSRDERYLLTSPGGFLVGGNDLVTLWNIETGEKIFVYEKKDFNGGNISIYVDFSSDSKDMIIKVENFPTEVINISTLEKTGELPNHRFSRFLLGEGISLNSDKKIKRNLSIINFYDIKTKEVLHRFNPHKEYVEDIAFSNYSLKYMATAGRKDRTVKLWHVPARVKYSNKRLTKSSLSIEEIETMSRFGVKVAFPNEREARLLSPSISPAQLITAEFLDLSGMHLRKLPSWLSNFTKLRRLNLKNNQLLLENLGELRYFQVLETLDLSGNPLFSSGYYDLDSNDINNIDLSKFGSRLEVLNIANNNIKKLNFFDMPSLEKLKVEGNSGMVLDMAFGEPFTLQKLRALDIDHNIRIPKGLKMKLDNWKK